MPRTARDCVSLEKYLIYIHMRVNSVSILEPWLLILISLNAFHIDAHPKPSRAHKRQWDFWRVTYKYIMYIRTKVCVQLRGGVGGGWGRPTNRKTTLACTVLPSTHKTHSVKFVMRAFEYPISADKMRSFVCNNFGATTRLALLAASVFPFCTITNTRNVRLLLPRRHFCISSRRIVAM